MRISDWSSDVCSSDLIIAGIIESGGEIGFRVTDDPVEIGITGDRLPGCRAAGERGSIGRNESPVRPSALTEIVKAMEDCHIEKIGRASCRDRVGQYV